MKKILCVLLALLLLGTAGCQSANPDFEDEALGDTVLDVQPNDDEKDDEEPAPSEDSKTPDDHTHTWEDATCLKAKTCSDCGETQGKALGHDFKGTSCTTDGKCSRCDEIEKATGHQYKDGVCKTCGDKKEEDSKAPEAHTHTWVEATCLAPKTCSGCGETTGKTVAHTKVPATCAVGEICTVCKTTFSEPLGHEFVNDTCKKCKEKITMPLTVEYTEELEFSGVKFTILQCDVMDVDRLAEGEARLEVFSRSISGGENRFRVVFTDAKGIIISDVNLGSTSVPGDTQLNKCTIPANTAKITVTFA